MSENQNQVVEGAETENQQEQKSTTPEPSLEELLKDDAFRAQFEDHIKGLKSALEKERENNRKLLAVLRKAGVMEDEQEKEAHDKVAELQSALDAAQQALTEKERALLHVTDLYTTERVRNSVLRAALRKRVGNPDLIASIALGDEWYAKLEVEDGEVNNAEEIVDAILKEFPELSGQRLGTPVKRELPPDGKSVADYRIGVRL